MGFHGRSASRFVIISPAQFVMGIDGEAPPGITEEDRAEDAAAAEANPSKKPKKSAAAAAKRPAGEGGDGAGDAALAPASGSNSVVSPGCVVDVVVWS